MMPRIAFYSAVLTVVVVSLVFGLDWQHAPLPAVLQDQAQVQAALDYVQAQAKIRAEATAIAEAKAAEAKAKADALAKAKAPPPIVAVATPVVPAPPPPAPKVIAAQPPPPVQEVRAEPPKEQPLCDVAACAAAYRSFRESDCTFNPSVGPRRLCTKGVVPVAAAPTETAPAAADAPAALVKPEPGAKTEAAQISGRCNVSACAAAYMSFTQSDCTYQPSDGPRRLCTK